jgi:hypothetical protein
MCKEFKTFVSTGPLWQYFARRWESEVPCGYGLRWGCTMHRLFGKPPGGRRESAVQQHTAVSAPSQCHLTVASCHSAAIAAQNHSAAVEVLCETEAVLHALSVEAIEQQCGEGSGKPSWKAAIALRWMCRCCHRERTCGRPRATMEVPCYREKRCDRREFWCWIKESEGMQKRV